jgi:hypothetical protein
MAYLKSLPKSWWMKVHGNEFQVAGVPDIMGCYHGLTVGFEVKVLGNKPTKRQEFVGKCITEAGGLVFVIHNTKEARLCIDHIDECMVSGLEAMESKQCQTIHQCQTSLTKSENDLRSQNKQRKRASESPKDVPF